MISTFRNFLFVLALAALPVATPAQQPQAVETQEQTTARLSALLDALHPQRGSIAIPAAHAALDLGESYYFLPAEEAKRVLIEGWGNPADAVGDVLGMVFPAGKTPLDDTWGAVLTFEESGYVDDSDAKEIDYSELLGTMKDATVARNTVLSERGLPTQELVGWAQQPTYDPVRKSMVWARDIRFSNTQDHTLNYDVRLLARRGVLSVNMVAGMKDLPVVRTAAAEFGQKVAFDRGERYADFDSSTDKTAEYGLAGLVAASAGAAAAKKLGLLAILFGFGKKFIVLIGVAFAAMVGFVKRLFRRKEEAEY